MQNGEINTFTMKRLLIILFSTFSMVLYGQDYIARLSANYMADTSIIRRYTNEWSVVYTGSATAGNHLHLVNMNMGSVYSVDVDEDVTDMEILDDTLYYCGTLLPYYSVLNFLALQQFFTGYINLRVGRITPPAVYLVPKKLEVFRATGGVHAIVVGDYQPPYSSRTDSYMVDFWRYQANVAWNHVYLYTEDKECYDDVTVTDNYVVASAHVCHSTDIILRVLDKPSEVCPTALCPTNHHIFSNCMGSNTCEYTTYSYSGDDYKKPGGHGEYPICLTHTTGDHVALASTVELWGQTGVTVKDIEIVAGSPYVVQNIVDSKDDIHYLRDIRYDAASDSLLMIVKQVLADGGRDGIARLDRSSFSTFTFTYPLIANGAYGLHSIDKGGYMVNPYSPGDNVYRKMASGWLENGNGEARAAIWSHFFNNTGCNKTLVLEKSWSKGEMLQSSLPFQNKNNLYIRHFSTIRAVTQSSIIIDCGVMNVSNPE